jgi:ABC-2 type transport system permease protein
MIAVTNFIGLPLLFVSSTLIAVALMPNWMEWAARFNPVEWGVRASRDVVTASTAWDSVARYLGLLAAVTAAMAAFATLCFRAYRRTL